MRWIVGGKAAAGCAASASQMGRFETRWLTAQKNPSALADLSGRWIDIVHGRRPPRGVVLDMDSSVSPTHGEQEMSVWNGHYSCTCYHPLFVFNQFGDLERCALRPGNVHSADGWDGVLKPVVARYHSVLQERISYLLTRPIRRLCGVPMQTSQMDASFMPLVRRERLRCSCFLRGFSHAGRSQFSFNLSPGSCDEDFRTQFHSRQDCRRQEGRDNGTYPKSLTRYAKIVAQRRTICRSFNGFSKMSRNGGQRLSA